MTADDRSHPRPEDEAARPQKPVSGAAPGGDQPESTEPIPVDATEEEAAAAEPEVAAETTDAQVEPGPEVAVEATNAKIQPGSEVAAEATNGNIDPGPEVAAEATNGEIESGPEPGADQDAGTGEEPQPEALPAVAAEPDAEPEPGADVRRTPWSQVLGWSRSPAALLVGVLIGLLGFGLAVQVRSNTSTSGLPAARQEDLVRILDDLSSREDRLRRQIAELEAARTRLSTTGDSSSTALEEARKRSDALGILAGTVPAQGPGIRLTLTDPEHRLAAEDLLDTVEELRAAGAEAIQVGGVRIGLDSSFTSTDRGLAVDGVAVATPYQIVAIGDPATLATAMEIPGGVADTAQRAGGAARTEQVERVVIRALRAVRTPRYSQPTN